MGGQGRTDLARQTEKYILRKEIKYMLGVGKEWERNQQKERKKSQREGVIFKHPVFWPK